MAKPDLERMRERIRELPRSQQTELLLDLIASLDGGAEGGDAWDHGVAAQSQPDGNPHLPVRQ